MELARYGIVYTQEELVDKLFDSLPDEKDCEEAAKQQMVFLASILESYESLVAGKNGNTNLTKEYYDQIDPEEMELIDIRWCMASASELLPEEDSVGYAFITKIVPFKDTRTEEVKYVNRKMTTQCMKDKIYRTWKEAKSAKRWDADRECYLDSKGNIVVESSSVSVETLIEQIAEEEEARQRMWWSSEEEEKEKELQPKKVDDGIIDTTKEFTAENLKKMADKVLAAKELEVDSESGTESKSKVRSNDSTNESGKTDKAKIESDCKNCMKDCKDCSTHAYLSGKKTEELTKRVKEVENQILSRDKLVKASNERIKELTNKLENDKTDLERVRKENEKLIHENRQLSENHEKLKGTIKDSDERNDKTTKENFQLSGVLQSKEKQINQQLDEIANLKRQFQEAKIENERINLKLNSYNPQVPPPVLNNFSKKKSGLVNDEEINEVKLPDTIDVIFTSSSDEDSVQSEKPKSEEKKASSPKPKVSETKKSSSSTKKMYVPLDYYKKLEKQKFTSEKKYVVKKDQSSGQPPNKYFFLYKEVAIGSEESLKMNDKNFPPLYIAKKAWVASKYN
ncbi:synaptonemal complex protein 1-like [Helianthus annuus]|uniref:synaptonemal complex protein 1-like n=1 Tax=Helianthus annuus TaxID=4232 RepID=UPI000B8F4FF9|nr:synaptonemal complex protein 1-like [Helianthus annuus]